jgi:hypothetical protein
MARIHAPRPKTTEALHWLSALGALACVLCAADARAQDACASDTDCDAELVCMRVLFGVDCNDAGCLEVQEQGFCSEPSPDALRCDDNDACPSPLYCDVDNLNGPLCAFAQPLCGSSDDACPEGFMCVDLEPLGGCELCQDTDDGITCTPAPCAENNLNLCSPIATACAEDADCVDGFVCGEVGPFDLQTGWDESLVGTRACLSIGLIALTDGVVVGGQDPLPDGGVGEPPFGGTGGSAGNAGDGAGGSAGASGGAAAGEGGASGAGMPGGASGASSGGGDSDGSSGCSCNVRKPSTPRAITATLLLLMLTGALLVRRWPVG